MKKTIEKSGRTSYNSKTNNLNKEEHPMAEKKQHNIVSADDGAQMSAAEVEA